MEFTFYWLNGEREVLYGTWPGDALNHSGYGNGALPALDFWAHGNNRNYTWNKKKKEWIKKRKS